MNYPACALTIAGTDPSGGAGIHADLKTFQEFKCYGMSVITSVVAQNTTGVQQVHHLPAEMVKEQLESVSSDIPVHAWKTGMIANKEMMRVIAEHIVKLDAPYVMDPVMVATSGDALIEQESRNFLIEHLLPHTTLVTPNIPEAAFIIGEKIKTLEDMQQAASQIVDVYGAGAALVKGGHREGEAVDFLYDGSTMYTFSEARIQTSSTHGTGCTYSAAITACLSKGMPLAEAVKQAKTFVTAAIRHAFLLGSGNGPTNHWALREQEVQQ